MIATTHRRVVGDSLCVDSNSEAADAARESRDLSDQAATGASNFRTLAAS
jgi:hypothetical protein